MANYALPKIIKRLKTTLRAIEQRRDALDEQVDAYRKVIASQETSWPPPRDAEEEKANPGILLPSIRATIAAFLQSRRLNFRK